MRSSILVSILALALILGACGPRPATDHPRLAMVSYARTIETNNPKAAYAMLSKRMKKLLSFKAFMRKWKKNYAELKLQAADIRKGLKKEKAYKVRARLRLGKRRRVSLTLEKGSWRIHGGVGSGFGAVTPREAIVALVRALQSRNFNAFLNLLSKSRRETFVRELGRRLEKLKANLDRDVEISGNRARFQYDPQYWILLVKENGVWRIVEFN